MDEPKFRMGRLDHVHIRVPNRAEAEGQQHVAPDGNLVASLRCSAATSLLEASPHASTGGRPCDPLESPAHRRARRGLFGEP